MDRLNIIIERYEKNPQDYEHNPYRCYEECKKEILKMQEEGLVGLDSKSYNDCIDYVTEKLKICRVGRG